MRTVKTKLIALAACAALLFAFNGAAGGRQAALGGPNFDSRDAELGIMEAEAGPQEKPRGSAASGSVPVYEWNNGAMVSLDFDDGWKSAYERALPILEDARFKGTFYITTEERWSNFMTISNIRRLERLGHAIANHTETHPRLAELSDADIEREIVGAQKTLESWDIRTVPAFAYPYNSRDERVVAVLEEAGFKYARTTVQGLNTKNTDPYLLRSRTPDRNTTFQEIRRDIDAAIESGSWYILSFHRFDDKESDLYSTSSELFQQIVDYLKERKVRVVTVDEGARILWQEDAQE